MSSDQQHRITYKAGITRTPSDFLCQDGELAECINLTTDNEELKPVVQPSEFMTGMTGKLLYVHKFNDQKRYIVLDGNDVIWGTDNEGHFDPATETIEEQQITRYIVLWTVPSGETPNVTSIGKTLIVSDSSGLHYLIWKPEEYKFIGSGIPVPEVEFALSKQDATGHASIYTDDDTGITWQTYIETTAHYTGALEWGFSGWTIKDQQAYNDLMLGLYSEHKKKIAQKKAFCLPFFVRTAIELTDGSYTHISQPILMLPSITRNVYTVDYNNTSENETFKFRTEYSHLYYRSRFDYTDWKDIVNGVVVFISAPIEINEILSDLLKPDEFGRWDIGHDRIVAKNYLSTIESQCGIDIESEIGAVRAYYYVLSKREQLDINNDITSTSLFYKLAKLGLNGTNYNNTHHGWEPMGEKFGKHLLENLTVQTRLESDDYYSYSKIKADVLFPYNSRLNLAGVSRGFFEGFHNFMPFVVTRTIPGIEPVPGIVNQEAKYKFYVTIETDGGDIIVLHSITTNQIQGIWFYYPDPRAKHVLINKEVDNGGLSPVISTVLDADLKEHSGLNGAYYFGGISPDMEEPNISPVSDPATTNNDDMELLPNYIITSEVNNPFVFKAGGYNKVGTGKILAISTTTMALAQDQFGKTPLIVFSDSGVWGMHVDRTGLYESIDPFTRDVLVNPHNVIQTDGAVFFVSKRGLMVATDKGVRCMSERIDGKPFNTSVLTGLANGTDWSGIVGDCQTNDTFQKYVRSDKCVIAYDYIDSRLIITNPDYNFSYIMGLADGSISKTILPALMTNVVNNYPDYLMQGTVTETVQSETVIRNVLYTLYGKQHEEDVSSRQLAFLLTRPMKFGGPVGKTSLRELLNVGFWDEGTVQTPLSCVKAKLYISDDMKNWYEATSRFGAAAKYFRLALFIKMLPTERLSGTVIRTQDRRTDNMI